MQSKTRNNERVCFSSGGFLLSIGGKQQNANNGNRTFLLFGSVLISVVSGMTKAVKPSFRFRDRL
jgi:hypothetical protein